MHSPFSGSSFRASCVGLGLWLASLAPLQAEVKLHPTFSDHAVLQRHMAVPIWGTASDGEKVVVEFAGQKKTTIAQEGRWMVKLGPMKANAVGGLLTVTGPNNALSIDDVVVGEVWVCSGQSNMEWPMNRSYQPDVDIASSLNTNLRLFTVTKRRSVAVKTDLDYARHVWMHAAPDTVKNFSAVGYYFGRDLVTSLKGVPVGLIHTSWGGSSAEAWVRRAVLEADSEYQSKIVAPVVEAQKKWRLAVADWERRKAESTAKGSEFTEKKPGAPGGWDPGELYGGMLANIIPYGIRGAIWYQGESNAGRAWQYRRLFGDMITNWRQDWGQGNFPFYAVQLAPWDKNKKRELHVIASEIVDSDWAQLREAQDYVARTLPQVDVAVITDVGDKDDIHPTRKATVGERLSRLAREQIHGENILSHGPRLKSVEFEDQFARLTFKDTGSGLRTSDGGVPTGFLVAGADQKWHPATAKIIDGKHLQLTSIAVPRPVAVRYGWNDYPVVNLMNGDGLPATPFRTDAWPVSTQGQ